MLPFLKRYAIISTLIIATIGFGIYTFIKTKRENALRAEIFYKKSLDLLKARNYKKSEIYLGLAIKDNPKAEYYYSAYRLLISLNRAGEAEFYLKKAIEKDPKNPNYYYHAAGVIGEYNEKAGIDYIKKAIKLEPKNCDYLRLYARLLYAVGKYSETYKQLNQCLEYDKADVAAWNNLAVYHSFQKENQKALEIWQKAAKANPESTYIWYHYGLKAKEMNGDELAVMALKKRIALEPYSGADAAKLISEITGEKMDPTYAKYFEELKVTMPLSYAHNCVYIPATFEGVTGLFLIDTGATESHVYKKFLRENQLKVFTGATGVYQTAGGTISVPIIYADFKIAGVAINNIRVGVLSDDPYDGSAGIIGQNIIQNFKLEIDRTKGVVVLRAN